MTLKPLSTFRRRSPASIIAQAAASVAKPPELAKAEAVLADERQRLADLRAENGKLYNELTSQKVGTRNEAALERQIRDVQAKASIAEGRIRDARRRRAELMPDYAAALTEALAGPTGEAARRILELLPEMRAAVDVIREAAVLTAPAYIAEMGSNPAYASVSTIDLRGLAALENMAGLLVPPPVAEAAE
jgi:hypothetical protein